MGLLLNDGIRAGASQPAAGGGTPGEYKIAGSLRWNDEDDTLMQRTFATPTSQQKFTISYWAKAAWPPGQDAQWWFCNNDSSGSIWITGIDADEKLRSVENYPTSYGRSTTKLFWDPGAWYHFCFICDTTDGTGSDRTKIYVNGVRVDDNDHNGTAALNENLPFNEATVHNLGTYATAYANYCDLYVAEFIFIDGQAYDISKFGELDTKGIWQPKDPASAGFSYGNNGGWYKFTDSSNLGKDFSGEDHHWTTITNFTTSGTGNDMMVDSPSNGDTTDDTGAGGQLAANYPTWNPHHKRSTSEGAESLSTRQGNLVCDIRNTVCATTMPIPAGGGKFYYEFQMLEDYWVAALCPVDSDFESLSYPYGVYNLTGGLQYNKNGDFALSGSVTSSWGSTYGTGDTIGVAMDFSSAGNGKVWFSKISSGSHTWQASGNPATGANPAASSLTGDYIIACNDGGGGSPTHGRINFGQHPFEANAPTGFKCLCSANLPDTFTGDDVNHPGKFFGAKAWTGNGGATRTIDLWEFEPAFAWVKERPTDGWEHTLYDKVRGVGTNSVNKSLPTSGTRTEASGNNTNHGYLSSWEEDGFGIVKGSQGGGDLMNHSGWTYVGYCWHGTDAGANNNGSINVASGDQFTNDTAGFSVTKWTGTGANATIGHGLSAAPEFIINRNYTDTQPWTIYHVSMGNTKHMNIDDATPEETLSTVWNDTSPSSTVFSVGSTAGANGNGQSMITYCWRPIQGFSKFGKYKGDDQRPFINCGFSPALIIIKRKAGANGSWYMFDTGRSTLNPATVALIANSANAESTSYSFDLYSNGFRVMSSSDGDVNDAGTEYIYAAWAEQPLKTARAR